MRVCVKTCEWVCVRVSEGVCVGVGACQAGSLCPIKVELILSVITEPPFDVQYIDTLSEKARGRCSTRDYWTFCFVEQRLWTS